MRRDGCDAITATTLPRITSALSRWASASVPSAVAATARSICRRMILSTPIVSTVSASRNITKEPTNVSDHRNRLVLC